MLKGEYPTAFPLKHQQKDLRLVLELADSTSQPLPVAAAANSLFEQVTTTLNSPTALGGRDDLHMYLVLRVTDRTASSFV